ncbi:hypothetical protein [Dyadobacter luticola]|uniref:RadC-like JAB domain-containing protein n=1 Tax=Dyadobacter luticola TaxID=1979387 RepID=A0A5R9KLR7_9BACT|nr:hypothetical protein [Dyadobacter luticola]TLU96996.1 hypothetical protein FEN17_27135 [Dyadobacter luticola]
MESFANVSNLYQVAEIELIYKSKVQASQRPKIESSKDAYKVLMQSWNPDRLEFIEEFKILLLNNASRVLGIFEVSKGGIVCTPFLRQLLVVVFPFSSAGLSIQKVSYC